MELIVFYSFTHENEYTDYVEELAIKESKEKALLYLLLLDEVCKQHMYEIYDFKLKRINTDVISRSWQTESSLKAIRLMFMITNCYPPDECNNVNLYSICTILKSDYAEYYLEALRIWLGIVDIK